MSEGSNSRTQAHQPPEDTEGTGLGRSAAMKAQSVPGQRRGPQREEAVPTLPRSASCSTPSLPIEPSLVLGAGLPSSLRVPARPRCSSCLLTHSQHSLGSAVEGYTLHSRVWDLRPHSCPQMQSTQCGGPGSSRHCHQETRKDTLTRSSELSANTAAS